MKDIKVRMLIGEQNPDGSIRSQQEMSGLATMDFDGFREMMDELATVTVVNNKELKRRIKKLDYKVLVLCVKDRANENNHHIWLTPLDGVKKVEGDVTMADHKNHGPLDISPTDLH